MVEGEQNGRMSEEIMESPKKTLIFSYGTLKRGFPNYHLIDDLIPTNDAVYLGAYVTVDLLPLVLGPHGVPYLLNLPGSSGHRVHGELFAVSNKGLERLDELEGLAFGHYERLPIRVVPEIEADDGGGNDRPGVETEAEAYFAHRSYAKGMWKRSKREGMGVYTKDMVKNYVKREDRPRNRSFMEEVRLFCSSG